MARHCLHQQTGSVTELHLRNPYDPLSFQDDGEYFAFQLSRLSGKINPSLVDLKYLEYLDLSLNNFENTSIPNFIGSLQSLTYLNLSLSYFVGEISPDLGNLSNLRILDLHASFDLEIYVPNTWVSHLNWISRLPSLQYLNLGYVNASLASATWLQEVSMLHSLDELHLPSCDLQSLPFSLPVVNFSSIRVINLRDNHFNSSIPQWLFSLCNLQILDLSFNQISGELDDFVDGLSKCRSISLEFLTFMSNNLSGMIPESLANFKNLKLLILKGNSLSGSIPASIDKLSNLEILSFRDNRLTGNVPQSIGGLNKLAILSLRGNNFEGAITSRHFLHLENLISFTFSSGNKPVVFDVPQDWVPPFSLQIISITKSQIGPDSNFPSWLQTQKDLVFLSLVEDGISGQIPDWVWQLSPQLQVLDLSINKLHGKLPESLMFPPGAYVNLSFNEFQGPIPLWPPTLTLLSLKNNSFSGPIPENIGLQMRGLQFLDLSNNQLCGKIPISICSLPALSILKLSSNNISGRILTCLGNSSSLNDIDLSRNHLQGEIPEEITFLSALSSLDLSWNQLTGNIPWKIGSLGKLETLDFSHNHLSGPIPASMSSMTLLNQLNLSYNDLSGPIPTTNKFKTFNDPSIYEGNPKLCGPPLPISCSTSTKDDHSTEDEDEPDWLLLSMLVGFLVGLLTFFSSLAIITSWRHAYFQFVDEIRDRIFTCFNRIPLLLNEKMYWQRL